MIGLEWRPRLVLAAWRSPAFLMAVAAVLWGAMWLPLAWGMGPGLELLYMAGFVGGTLALDGGFLACLGRRRLARLWPCFASRTPWRLVYALCMVTFGLFQVASRLLDPAVVAVIAAVHPLLFVLAGRPFLSGVGQPPALRWGLLAVLCVAGVAGGAMSVTSMNCGLGLAGFESLTGVLLGLGAVAMALVLMPFGLAMARCALQWRRETGMPQSWCGFAGRVPVFLVLLALVVAGAVLLTPAGSDILRPLIAGGIGAIVNWVALWLWASGLGGGRGVGAQAAMFVETPVAVALLAVAGLGAEGVDWRLLAPGVALAALAACGSARVGRGADS